MLTRSNLPSCDRCASTSYLLPSPLSSALAFLSRPCLTSQSSHHMWCPNFLNTGTCSDRPQCPHQHPNFFCDTCGLAFNTQAEYSVHFTTKRHQKAIKAVSRTLSTAPRICKVCSVKLTHPNDISLHERGRTHCVRLQDLNKRGVHYTRKEMYPADEDVVFIVTYVIVWSGTDGNSI